MTVARAAGLGGFTPGDDVADQMVVLSGRCTQPFLTPSTFNTAQVGALELLLCDSHNLV